ncbi:hypothetical protein RHMOL_Rhmol08G0039100 [Rhododendron molle]|uniref:Uncharacterized protein n=1 Tax=Rhododendron molle TaxID=49168 RepID=A0ACC0MKZ1_RHOML|nr:hypothetical protein RHMOL_Rhmol08G0039100 [Rhododendron molle]
MFSRDSLLFLAMLDIPKLNPGPPARLSPWFATANVALGFMLMTYVIAPVAYWLSMFNFKTFPIFSDGLFTSTGQNYNITSIIGDNFHIDFQAYDREGPLYLSTFLALTYALSFACVTASVVHVLVFHGRELWQQSKSAFKEKQMDVHTKLMRKYEQVPEWWFSCILLLNITAAVLVSEYCKDQLQLPWWGVLMTRGLALFFTLPIGVITATTNQTPALKVTADNIIGYIYPGYPVANMCFKVYGFVSMKQAIAFLQDFKLGYYMKIPPRSMFMAQVSLHFRSFSFLRKINEFDSKTCSMAAKFFPFYDITANGGAATTVLSGALDAGLAFMAVLLYLCLEMQHVDLSWWGSDRDGCPLASCPTADGIIVKVCPGYIR